jgi:hypothetical protein
VLIYCRDHRCNNHIEINADCRADVEPKFLCTACGQRGGETRPKFDQPRMETGG